MPTQVLLQSGPGLVAAGQQELRGASGGAVNQPHRQLQDRRAGYRRSRGGQVSQTRPRVSSRPLPSSTYGALRPGRPFRQKKRLKVDFFPAIYNLEHIFFFAFFCKVFLRLIKFKARTQGCTNDVLKGVTTPLSSAYFTGNGGF